MRFCAKLRKSAFRVSLYSSSVHFTPISVRRARPERTKAITPKAEIGKNAHERRKGLGRVRFLARLEAIREAVRQGYPVQMIYETQQREGLGISYSQFTRYVNQFVHASGEVMPLRHQKGTTVARSGDQASPAKGVVNTPPGFRYQPVKGDDELV